MATQLSRAVTDGTVQSTNAAIDALTSAVQGLGQTLGSDKANISGDNIANPSTFRNNIGLGWTELAQFNALSETKYYSLSGYTMIALVIFYKPDDRIYTLATTCGLISELLDSHLIACMNDGSVRKCQLNFKNTYATCENFSNITYAKLYGYN